LRIKIRCMYKHIFHHMYQEKEKLEAPGLVCLLQQLTLLVKCHEAV